jgi:hypothetical protein
MMEPSQPPLSLVIVGAIAAIGVGLFFLALVHKMLRIKGYSREDLSRHPMSPLEKRLLAVSVGATVVAVVAAVGLGLLRRG